MQATHHSTPCASLTRAARQGRRGPAKSSYPASECRRQQLNGTHHPRQASGSSRTLLEDTLHFALPLVQGLPNDHLHLRRDAFILLDARSGLHGRACPAPQSTQRVPAPDGHGVRRHARVRACRLGAGARGRVDRSGLGVCDRTVAPADVLDASSASSYGLRVAVTAEHLHHDGHELDREEQCSNSPVQDQRPSACVPGGCSNARI